MEKLAEALQEEDTVLFIGSGISCWSGLPSWAALIEALAEFVTRAGHSGTLIRQEADRGDLLQAASYGFDLLTKQQIGEFIRKSTQLGQAQPHEVHRKIVSLGPRYFVTTNYDSLIEDSLRRWRPQSHFRLITNRQLSAMAEIVHTRATDLVFKPHGDAGDTDSIILTREQYRQLLPDGDRHSALESLKIVLASRPVVYLGFGLRDPDFMYIRDLLANTYKGGARDHFAVMADVSHDEVTYWRRHYGIHLASYETKPRENGSRDHAALLVLLDRLLRAKSSASAGVPTKGRLDPDLILRIARHAARLTRTPREIPEFPVRIQLDRGVYEYSDTLAWLDPFEHSPVEHFLDHGPNCAIVTGAPGAGKSYALRSSAARYAEHLHEACLSDNLDPSAVTVPLFVDLKLYQGNLWELAEQTLPANVRLDTLVQTFRVKFFLDSFNEAPRRNLDAFDSDYSRFKARAPDASIIIGSRSRDGLEKLDLKTYRLDYIDTEFVEKELARKGRQVTGRFSNEMMQLLQKPLYFRLVLSGEIELPPNPHPREFFQSFIRGLCDEFSAQHDSSLDLTGLLSAVAFDALNRGEEAFAAERFDSIFEQHQPSHGVPSITTEDLVNWLVSRNFLIPYIGARVAFFHQSVTEFLAAQELARRYAPAQKGISELLVLTRWDQAVFLAISLMSENDSKSFFESLITTDFGLAIKAAKYCEWNLDEIVSRLLTEIPKQISNDHELDWPIELALKHDLPVSPEHEPLIRNIMMRRNSIGGAAARCLARLKGAECKTELLESLEAFPSDYNYCANGLAPALKPLVDATDACVLAGMADALFSRIGPDYREEDFQGFVTACAKLLEGLDIETVVAAFGDGTHRTSSPLRIDILCDWVNDQRTTSALKLAGDLLLRGIDKASTSIYFIAEFSSETEPLSWDSFGPSHVERLIEPLSCNGTEDEISWAPSALLHLCRSRSDLRAVASAHATKFVGLGKALLLHLANGGDAIYDALDELSRLDTAARRREPTWVLDQIELNWIGREDLLVKLLRLRDAPLAMQLISLLDRVHMSQAIGTLNIGSIDFWLDWMASEEDPAISYWFNNRLGRLFGRHLTPETQKQFVTAFNNEDCRHRELISRWILPNLKDVTTDSFTEGSISFLLNTLSHHEDAPTEKHLLGKSATETFVRQRLVPLLSNTTQPFARNLRSVLREAGRRHGRRYFTEAELNPG